MKRVVITGMGAVTPIGNTVSEYLQHLQQGTSGASAITRFDAALFKTRFACEVKNFKPEVAIDRKEVRRVDLYTQFALVATDEAMKMSGIDLKSVDLDRCGIIYASGIGGLMTLEQEISEYARGNGTPRYNPFMIPKMISNIASGHIAIKYGFRGVNYATVSACASANHSIINALDYIRLGKADVVIAGGAEASICATGVGGFTSMHAMSTRNDDPATASRPFDKDRDGFVLGEGGATLILEELQHARKRGATIFGEVIGGGMNCDAYHITAPHPEGIGVVKCMQLALQDAHLAADAIDYVNVHGTSTPLGDVAEIKALQKMFGDHAYKLNISSTKSMTGHLLGAAGAVEAVAAILSLQHDFIPPTINHQTADPAIDPKLNLTLNVAQQRKVNVAMSNGFGFGGHNTSVIFKQFVK
jgi:3-oxoacyl-[acyl-carrier-protein] synthase II